MKLAEEFLLDNNGDDFLIKDGEILKSFEGTGPKDLIPSDESLDVFLELQRRGVYIGLTLESNLIDGNNLV